MSWQARLQSRRRVRSRRGSADLEAGVEPAEAARLAAADGAEAGHGANLTLTISVKRPLGRTAISVGAAIWRDQASASVTVRGTGMPGRALAPPGDRLLPGVAGVLEADPLAVAGEPALVVDLQRRPAAGLLVGAVADAIDARATAACRW